MSEGSSRVCVCIRVYLSTNAAWYKYKGPVAEIVLALSGSIARESEWLE